MSRILKLGKTGSGLASSDRLVAVATLHPEHTVAFSVSIAVTVVDARLPKGTFGVVAYQLLVESCKQPQPVLVRRVVLI